MGIDNYFNDPQDHPNKEVYVKKLHRLSKAKDTEHAHSDADKVLWDLLILLGYASVVDAYNKVEKWYA